MTAIFKYSLMLNKVTTFIKTQAKARKYKNKENHITHTDRLQTHLSYRRHRINFLQLYGPPTVTGAFPGSSAVKCLFCLLQNYFYIIPNTMVKIIFIILIFFTYQSKQVT